MADTEKTFSEIEFLKNYPSVSVEFYTTKAPNVPIVDIGDLFARVLNCSDWLVVGDTDDAFTVFMTRKKESSRILAVTFTPMSFAQPPAEGPPMQRAQYNRYHAVLMDFDGMQQMNVPFVVPDDLVYQHGKAMWGLRKDGQPDWSIEKAKVVDAISQLLGPFVEFVEMSNLNF